MRRFNTNTVIVTISLLSILLLLLFAWLRDNTEPISAQHLEQLLQSDDEIKVALDEKMYRISIEDKSYSILSSEVDPKLFSGYIVHAHNTTSLLLIIFLTLLALALLSVAFRYAIKHRSVSKARPQSSQIKERTILPVKADVRFDDIGGISDVKEELEEIIDFLKSPKRYREFGARLPRGVLLVGPPGVGKTMIAKAVAREAGVPFYYQSAASFVQIYAGSGAKRVEELFQAASKNSPSIVFIDEIDAVGKERSSSSNNSEREATLNQLLVQMDGFADSSNIIVMAATNKIELLDSALLRSGRFDRRIFVDPPTLSEREAIISKYLKQIPHKLDAKEISKITVGFSGASLAALINEAALMSLRNNRSSVQMQDLLSIKDKVVFGKRRITLIDEKQKRYRALYLAAKSIIASHFDLEFEKVILGSERVKLICNRALLQSEIEARVCMLLGGMVASKESFGEHTSSVKDDIKEAKELVENMLFKYAMGSQIVAQESELSQKIDELQAKSAEILHTHKKALEIVTQILLDKESITKRSIDEIL